MIEWRESILKEFSPGLSRITVAVDPDNLLFEEIIFQRLTETGFDILFLEDPSDFTHACVSRYDVNGSRDRPDLLVVVEKDIDIIEGSYGDPARSIRKCSFSLNRLFPGLSYPAVKALDTGDLEALGEALARYDPGPLEAFETRDFILRHVLKIAPEPVKQPADLLALLLHRHYRRKPIPAPFDAHLISFWRKRGDFHDWPLESIVPDRTAFLIFLQERWPLFLDRFAENMAMISDWGAPYGFEFPGPLELPFGHEDVRAYISRLFSEGLLEPVEHHEAERLAGTWASIGIIYDLETDRIRRLHHLLTTIIENIPSPQGGYAQWLSFAPKWGEALALNEKNWPAENPEGTFVLSKIQARIDQSFLDWIHHRFAGLIGRPPSPHVTVHHIPWYLAEKIHGDPSGRLALIVLSGLSMDQWVVVRSVLKYQSPDLRYREEAVFACIPTLTSVSRQALFSGKAPFSIRYPAAADREPEAWSQFWEKRGFPSSGIGYIDGVDHYGLAELEEWMTRREPKVLGLTVNGLDTCGPGLFPTGNGHYGRVRIWTRTGFLSSLIDRLLIHGFRVWLASDHGNIETRGIGCLPSGITGEPGGERVGLYPGLEARTLDARAFPDALPGPSAGPPHDFPPLFAPGRTSFIQAEKRSVAHGGMSIEEVIVPLVEVFPRAR